MSDADSIRGRPWARQPKETIKAYAAFTSYLKLGIGRSIRKALILAGSKPSNHRYWERWAAKYKWTQRADQYDSDQLQTDMAGRHSAREQSRQPVCDDVPDMLRELRELSQGEVRVGITAKVRMGRDGKPVMTTIVDPQDPDSTIEVAVTEDAVSPKVRAQILETLIGFAGITKPVRTEISGPDGKELGGAIRVGLRDLDPQVLLAVAAAFAVEV